MIKIIFYLLFISKFSLALEVNSQYSNLTKACKNQDESSQIWILKQWHLGPNANTMETDSITFPQTKNQTNLYLQIKEWILTKEDLLLISEGCENEITENFNEKFNGWTYQDLNKKIADENYKEINTLLPLKLEVEFKDKLKTICGDSFSKMESQSRALSNMRGSLGFLTRLTQFEKDPIKAKPFLNNVIKLYKLKPKTSIAKAITSLKHDLKLNLTIYKKLLNERTLSFINIVDKNKSKNSIVVIGGLHADFLVEELNKKNKSCQVIEPLGYLSSDENVFESLERIIK